ncbi:hypothetical protein ACOMHN_048671 [Nucella lapillus]
MLIAGGTGKVGSGVALAALKQGARVTVATRSQERYNNLIKDIPQQFHQGLSVVVGDLSTEEGAKQVFNDATKQPGGVQYVVTAIQSNKDWGKGSSLVAQQLKAFQALTQEEARPHFLLMKNFLPYLDAQIGSSYTAVTGFPAASASAPQAANPLQYLAMGTVHGLVDGARAEFKESRVAVNEVHLKCLVQQHTDDDLVTVGPHRLGKDLVGAAVAAVVSSGTRDKVVISCRETARNWAGSKYVYVTKSSTRIYPSKITGGGKHMSP